ncbi:hypothetical protein C5167_042849 [Papaver somniferum]|uniref:Uncharacterized protein n=1 Tax=Papaver somniferum TaxID=3469 RepID=A0A4Y7L7B1_PAPSO|nr:hypothetical protein C5167_042849 [Papaver somniferum]
MEINDQGIVYMPFIKLGKHNSKVDKSVTMILQKTQMHARLGKGHVKFIYRKIGEGHVYSIRRFNVAKPTTGYRIVSSNYVRKYVMESLKRHEYRAKRLSSKIGP